MKLEIRLDELRRKFEETSARERRSYPKVYPKGPSKVSKSRAASSNMVRSWQAAALG